MADKKDKKIDIKEENVFLCDSKTIDVAPSKLMSNTSFFPKPTITVQQKPFVPNAEISKISIESNQVKFTFLSTQDSTFDITDIPTKLENVLIKLDNDKEVKKFRTLDLVDKIVDITYHSMISMDTHITEQYHTYNVTYVYKISWQ